MINEGVNGLQPTTEGKYIIASVGYHYYPSSVCKITTAATQLVSGYSLPPTWNKVCLLLLVTESVLKRQAEIKTRISLVEVH